ncbi:MAG: hypothetical protein KDC46_07185 [Thermoleophilia bacterium]|nr:hypothetical protein [Thermoleophilia bacterium]
MTGAVTKSAAAAAAATVEKVAAQAAPKAAEAAAETAGAAAPVIVQATRSMSGTGWLGLGAGAAGMAISLLDAWKQSVGSQQGFAAGSLVNPATISIGGGAVLLTLGEKAATTNVFMRNGLRSAGIALVLGGLAGAIAGAVNTFGNPLKQKTEAITSTQSQAPVRFGTDLPPAPANLAGIEMASADVIGKGRTLHRVPIYVDPATAAEMPEDATLGAAIGAARAAAQGDEQYRSHAVVQTKDGHYWIVRLSGDLDQTDGPKYSDGSDFDARYEPQIGRRQQALQAIAGVEGYYSFPEGMEPTAQLQYTGEIPWVTPELKGVKDAKSTTTTTPKTDDAAKAGS